MYTWLSLEPESVLERVVFASHANPPFPVVAVLEKAVELFMLKVPLTSTATPPPEGALIIDSSTDGKRKCK